jgi:hypothetical protein
MAEGISLAEQGSIAKDFLRRASCFDEYHC